MSSTLKCPYCSAEVAWDGVAVSIFCTKCGQLFPSLSRSASADSTEILIFPSAFDTEALPADVDDRPVPRRSPRQVSNVPLEWRRVHFGLGACWLACILVVAGAVGFICVVGPASNKNPDNPTFNFVLPISIVLAPLLLDLFGRWKCTSVSNPNGRRRAWIAAALAFAAIVCWASYSVVRIFQGPGPIVQVLSVVELGAFLAATVAWIRFHFWIGLKLESRSLRQQVRSFSWSLGIGGGVGIATISLGAFLAEAAQSRSPMGCAVLLFVIAASYLLIRYMIILSSIRNAIRLRAHGMF